MRLQCQGCGKRYRAPSLPPGAQPTCRACGEALLPVAEAVTGPTDPAGAWLVVMEGPSAGMEVEIAGTLTFGGAHGITILETRTGYALRSTTPATPARVNGRPVEGTLLADGDTVETGGVRYLFHVAPPAAAPAPVAVPAAVPPPVPAHAVPPTDGACSACGRTVPRTQLTRLGGRPVCRTCRRHAEIRHDHQQYTRLILGVGGGLVVVAIVAVVLLQSGTPKDTAARKSSPSPVTLSAKLPPPARPSAPARSGSRPDPAPETPKALSSRELVARTEPSVALVADGLGNGSGFLVRPDVLATNYHVVRSMFLPHITVRFPALGGAAYRVERMLHVDAKRDLCLLRIANLEGKPLALSRTTQFARGEDVVIIGNPGTGADLVLENAVSKGLLSAVTKIDGHTFYQISASINPGNSGGPVLNSRGEVVCIATLKASQEEGIAFGIPAHEVAAAVDRALANPDYPGLRKATAMHEARAAYYRTALLGLVYSVALGANIAALTSAEEAGVQPDVAVRATRAEYGPKLMAFVRRLEVGLEQGRNLAQGSPYVGAKAKAALSTLARRVDEVRAQSEDLPGPGIRRYVETSSQLLEQLQDSLKRGAWALDIPMEELENDVPWAR